MDTVFLKLKLLFSSKNRYIYVVLHGKMKGEWLVRVGQDKDNIIFFSLPDRYIRTVPIHDFEWGLKNQVLDIADVLPKNVYKSCIAEYNYRATEIKNTQAFGKSKR